MAKVIFKLDKERDLKNIWKACNSDISYGYDFKKSISKNILELCKGRDFEEVEDKLKKILKSTHNSKITFEIVKSSNSSWKTIEKEYFKRMNKLMKHKFQDVTVTGYLTTISKCPYSYNKKDLHFMFNLFSSVPYILHTAGHEIMHIYLHNSDWWNKVEKEIGNKQTHDLKEALTELLNLEFKDLWIIKDQGYPNHVKLREYISKQWKKKKDFEKLTENCIKWIKKNGVK